MADEQSRQSFEKLSKEVLIDKVVELQREKQELLHKLSETLTYDKSPVKFETSIANTGDKAKKSKHKAKKREFDFSKYNKRHVALMIAYLGWDMHGFAAQENISTTIESYLFDALIKAKLVECREGSNYSRCGRTDKGVSAFRQVISLDVRSNMADGIGVITSDGFIRQEKGSVTEIPYVQILNSLLPDEIRVLSWAPVSVDFDARFSCTYRKYKYFFPTADLNIELMDTAAKKLQGQHDFRNFCKMDVANGVTQFERNITSFDVRRLEKDGCMSRRQSDNLDGSGDGYEMCEAVICGSAFLWHQVRCMMSVLLMIGQGLEKPDIIDWLLDINRCPQRPQYNMALEFPLVLYDCVFEEVPWEFEPGIVNSLNKHLQRLWSVHSVRATMVQELLNVANHAATEKDTSSSSSSVSTVMTFSQAAFLVPGESSKTHKPFMKRALCESFEQKLENVNTKRKKQGKEILKVDNNQ